jgi:hypothetical protein
MILFLAGLILSIPVAIIANLCTPWVKTQYATRNSARRQKRINKITRDVARIELYRRAPVNQFVAYVTYRVIRAIGNFSFPVLFLTMVVLGQVERGVKNSHP